MQLRMLTPVDLLVTFGQHLCRPISPVCSQCPVEKYCDRVGVKIYC